MCRYPIVTTAKVPLSYQSPILWIFREGDIFVKSRYIDITTAKVPLFTRLRLAQSVKMFTKTNLKSISGQSINPSTLSLMQTSALNRVNRELSNFRLTGAGLKTTGAQNSPFPSLLYRKKDKKC